MRRARVSLILGLALVASAFSLALVFGRARPKPPSASTGATLSVPGDFRLFEGSWVDANGNVVIAVAGPEGATTRVSIPASGRWTPALHGVSASGNTFSWDASYTARGGPAGFNGKIIRYTLSVDSATSNRGVVRSGENSAGETVERRPVGAQ
jgi:hypothetical protein